MSHDHGEHHTGTECSGTGDCAACPSQAVAVERAVPLREAEERFRREAVHGVCDTGRYRCPYFVWGDGPPLLFIHGLSDAGRSMLLPFARLADSFRCIGYDLPTGRGDGACLKSYTHADLVADATALLDHLGVGPSYLVGSSFGSTITLAALHAYPQRFPRAILGGGFARRRLAAAEWLLALSARYWIGSMRHLPLHGRVARHLSYQTFLGVGPENWEFFQSITGSAPIRTVAYRALLMHRLDLRPLLPGIRQPVLMVCGDHDPLVDRRCEEALLQGLPNAGRVEIPDCGHFPQYSHPGVFAALIQRFLTPAACTSPGGNPS